jgi:VIT1/CCC1 family predicted Fe2+/Mn2+ transporter
MPPSHRESHRTGRTGWLRAAVLGANDGIVSTASLIVGVAAANSSPRAAFRVTFWGALAMGLTAGAGTLFKTVA